MLKSDTIVWNANKEIEEKKDYENNYYLATCYNYLGSSIDNPQDKIYIVTILKNISPIIKD